MWAANTAQEAFLIESIAGNAGRRDPDASPRLPRHSTGWASAACSPPSPGFLAQALYAREATTTEAARLQQGESEDAAAPDDVLSQVLWRTARAKIGARQGDLAGDYRDPGTRGSATRGADGSRPAHGRTRSPISRSW